MPPLSALLSLLISTPIPRAEGGNEKRFIGKGDRYFELRWGTAIFAFTLICLQNN